MSRLCVMIGRIDDERHPDEVTVLSRQDLPAFDPQVGGPATTVDQMESRAVTAGQELIRQLIVQQWQAFDQQCAAEVQRLSPPVHPER
jgi:hypothetical protein